MGDFWERLRKRSAAMNVSPKEDCPFCVAIEPHSLDEHNDPRIGNEDAS